MRVMKPARELNGNVKQPLLHFFRSPRIESPVFDVPLQVTVVHPLREDGRHAADLSDVVAGHNVGVQSKIDPGSAFMDEIVLALLACFRKVLRLRALHGQIRVPTVVVHFPHASHPACDCIGDHNVGVQNRSVLPDHFSGDGIPWRDDTGRLPGDIADRSVSFRRLLELVEFADGLADAVVFEVQRIWEFAVISVRREVILAAGECEVFLPGKRNVVFLPGERNVLAIYFAAIRRVIRLCLRLRLCLLSSEKVPKSHYSNIPAARFSSLITGIPCGHTL